MIKPMLKRALKRYLKTRGYRLAHIDRELKYLDIDDLVAVIRHATMLYPNRLNVLYEQVRYLEEADIAGAFVECGVWKGGAVGLMALTNMRHGRARRHLHLFDAFDDIAEPDPAVDGPRALSEVEMWSGKPRSEVTGKLEAMKGFYDNMGGHGVLEEVEALLAKTVGYPPEFLHFHKGWFENTVPADAAALPPIALLRLDGDWYSSTKVCLDHLYDRVVPGGFVIIDDYGAYEGCRKAVDEFLAARKETPFMSRVDEECVYWIKR